MTTHDAMSLASHTDDGGRGGSARRGLRVRGLAFSYGTRVLWSDIDLDIPTGRLHALVGPSGSGKTTLLNCLGLLAQPRAGTIEFDGVELTELGSGHVRRFRRDSLGYLFQDYALIEDATIRENLKVAMRTRRWSRSASVTAMTSALERVGLDGQRLGDHVAHLSGGEQQRVALARLLVRRPGLVLADEPTGALDAANGLVVIQHLRDLATEGACVVIATHNQAVRESCDSETQLGVAGSRGTPGP